MSRDVREVSCILEGMADKGLCTCGDFGETRFYGSPPFVPGILDFRCPTEALSQDGADFPAVDLSHYIGCDVGASGCPMEAIRLKTRPGVAPPPENQKALKAMLSKVTACEAGAPLKDAAGME